MWPYLRYETTSQQLSSNFSPRFPNDAGLKFYAEALSNPKYISVNRNFPSTDGRWDIQNLKTTDKNTLRTFWDTTLTRGENDFTMIDHRKRFLFDASWNQWKVRWKKLRGGVNDVVIDYESPYDWTPPCFGFYPMVEIPNVIDHGIDPDSDLTIDGGVMRLNSADTNVLRLNGYSLRITDNEGASITGASSTSLSWKHKKDNSSISMFCQFRVPPISSGKELNLIKIANGDILRIYATDVSPTAVNIVFEWQKSGSVAESITASNISVNTWYDCCFSFDNINNNFYGYFKDSANGTVWTLTDDFLYGSTSITDGVVSDLSPTNYPTNTTWKECYLLKTESGATLESPNLAYLQNVFIIDEYVSPIQFNTLRRLCYLWNKKTVSYPK